MRSSAALLVALLVVLGTAAGLAAGLPGGDRPSDIRGLPADAQAGTTGNETATNGTVHAGTTILISIRDDGHARWNVSATFVLSDPNETAAFRELGADYENYRTDAGFTRDTFERFVERADVDREMAIRDVNRSAHVRENASVGRLTLSFTWTNFTRVESDRVVLDDVFHTESGTWLPSLTDDQTLIVDGPDGYIIRESPPTTGVTNINVLRYEGPETFEPGEITVLYVPRSNPTTTTTDPPDGFLDLSGTSGLLVVLLVFGVGGAGAYALAQRRDPGGGADPSEDEPSATSPAPDDDGADEDEGVDPALLSDEERVLRLLRENDGRMKQADIVGETNWSNAKVSQLLSKMDDSDDVDKLRIGRENLITLPDEDVTDTD